QVFSSKLPSDPGLKLLFDKAKIEERSHPATNLFGREVIDPKTKQPVMVHESIVRAEDVVAELGGVPFFYTPYLVTDARDPLGPLESIHAGGNRIYGFQSGIGLNVYKLLGVLPIEGTKWKLYVDYLSRRGPALGSNFEYRGLFTD